MANQNDNTSLSFGRYLQAIRMEKGISLETVSKETRIRLETLVLMEDEDHDRLPQEVYVKGFLRAYAKAIGADGDEAIERYLSRLNVVRKIAESEADLNRSKKNFWPRLILSLLTLAVIIIATLFAVSYLRDRSAEKPQSGPTSTPSPIEQSAVEPVQNTTTIPVTEPVAEEVSVEKYALLIQSREETWMKVVADDQDPIEYNLTPGDKIELEAETGFTLLIGNAGGVELMLNGKPVQITGTSGQVVNLQLP